MRNERPLLFFSLIGARVRARRRRPRRCPVFLEYLDTGLVRRFPTAILSIALGVIAVISIATGLILDLVAHVRREAKRLAYLQLLRRARQQQTARQSNRLSA